MKILFITSVLCALNLCAAESAVLKQLGLGGEKQHAEKTSESHDELPLGDGCKSPRAVIALYNRNDSAELEKCFQDDEFNHDERIELAEKLFLVLKSRGIMIKTQQVSNDPNYRDPETGRERYVLTPKNKKIYLSKIEDKWVFSTDVLLTIHSEYDSMQWLSMRPLYELIPDWATEQLWGIDGLSLVQIALLFLLVIIGLAVRLIAVSICSRQVARVFVRLGMLQFEELIKRASMPLGNLAMAGFIALFVPGLDFNVHIAHFLWMAIRLGAGVSVVLLAYRSVDVFAYYMMERALKTESKLDDQLVPLFRKGLKIAIVIVGGIFVLQNLDVDVTSLLAGVTIGGLAFSFAARDTVANLFGSITIFADKPFLVGDWVKAAGVEGIVEMVGFRSTRIRTFYNSLVSVPNSKFTDSVVDNLGMRQYRRTLAELGVAYDTDPDQMEAFCNGVRGIIKAHPKTRKDYYEIHFSGYGDFSLKIMLYFFVKVSSWSEELRARHEIYLDILRLAKKMNIRFAFPTQTLHIETLAQAKEIREPNIPSPDDLTQAAAYFAPGGRAVIPPGPRVGPGYYAND